MAAVRAVRLVAHREPVSVELVELPDPGPQEVVVELAYGGVNPADRYAVDGQVAPDGPIPRTLGAEASGTADGRAVLVAGEGLGSVRDGVWAEAAVVPDLAVTPLPEGVDRRAAAAMGIAGLTAWNVVHEWARVSPGDRVLALGASGGVGTMIVSLARAAGATVWGQTGSSGKTRVIEEQGADRAIMADASGLAEALVGFEPTVVFDPLGDDFVRPAIDALVPRGRYVTFGTSAGAEVTFNMQTVYRKGISLLGYGGFRLAREERRCGLEAALAALARGELRVRIDEVLPLERVNEAFERLARHEVAGNLVLELD